MLLLSETLGAQQTIQVESLRHSDTESKWRNSIDPFSHLRFANCLERKSFTRQLNHSDMINQLS
jgi:hypothetical protein